MARKSLSVLIKPASSSCNLRCRYCFYADISKNRKVASNGIMSEETCDIIIERIHEALSGKGVVNISFQGGEPALAGLEYFEHFAEKMKTFPEIRVNYALQTNGTLITDEWAEFFHDHHFLIGISLDGYKLNSDKFRFDAENKSVFDQIMHTVKLLKKYNVEFNILSVITDELARHPKSLMKFYRENHFDYVQLIPCLPGLYEEDESSALTPERYESFFISFFDAWLHEIRKGNAVSVNLFENLYQMVHGWMPYQCGMLGKCSLHYVIESNGDVYPCDFYCLDEYKLGSLKDKSFQELFESRPAKQFLESASCMKKPCESCRYIKICSGGCRRQNICYLSDTECAYQKVLDHVVPVLRNM